MKSFTGLFIAAVLVAAPAFAQSKPAGEPAAKMAGAAKTMTATGTVSAVSADSVTVKGKTAEWTFAVDKSTVVTAKGGSHKMDAMKADKKPTMITEFVNVGDDVSVKYHDGAMKHAANVTVRAPSKK
ncbi:MAG: hypothetical protein ABIQ52_13900 [Vicinamibacterales bacterium]